VVNSVRVSHSLIVFGGLDGAGKSTQIDLLRARLARAGLRPALVWVRGGYTPLFTRAKALARRLGGRRVPPAGRGAARTRALARPWLRRAWLVLALVDLLLLLAVRVRLLRWRGRVVLCDRYLADTRVDFRLNFPGEAVERWVLWRLVERLAPRPDAAFLLLVPVAESERRSQAKREPFPDPAPVLVQRLAQYQALGAAGGCMVLDGSRPVTEVAESIATALGLERTDAYQPAA
jgi:thymidylate kinase